MRSIVLLIVLIVLVATMAWVDAPPADPLLDRSWLAVDARNARLQAKLDASVSVRFQDVAIREAIAQLGQEHGVEIHFHAKSRPAWPVRLHVRSMPLHAVIDHLAWQSNCVSTIKSGRIEIIPENLIAGRIPRPYSVLSSPHAGHPSMLGVGLSPDNFLITQAETRESLTNAAIAGTTRARIPREAARLIVTHERNHALLTQMGEIQLRVAHHEADGPVWLGDSPEDQAFRLQAAKALSRPVAFPWEGDLAALADKLRDSTGLNVVVDCQSARESVQPPEASLASLFSLDFQIARQAIVLGSNPRYETVGFPAPPWTQDALRSASAWNRASVRTLHGMATIGGQPHAVRQALMLANPGRPMPPVALSRQEPPHCQLYAYRYLIEPEDLAGVARAYAFDDLLRFSLDPLGNSSCTWMAAGGYLVVAGPEEIHRQVVDRLGPSSRLARFAARLYPTDPRDRAPVILAGLDDQEPAVVRLATEQLARYRPRPEMLAPPCVRVVMCSKDLDVQDYDEVAGTGAPERGEPFVPPGLKELEVWPSRISPIPALLQALARGKLERLLLEPNWKPPRYRRCPLGVVLQKWQVSVEEQIDVFLPMLDSLELRASGIEGILRLGRSGVDRLIDLACNACEPLSDRAQGALEREEFRVELIAALIARIDRPEEGPYQLARQTLPGSALDVVRLAEVTRRLLSSSATTRLRACEILGLLRAKSAIPNLVPATEDLDPHVREAAARTLRQLQEGP